MTLRVLRGVGVEPGDNPGNGGGAEVFEHADPLVALLNIIAVHIFHSMDGAADALAHVGLAQQAPLGGELRVRREHGEEAGGEGVPAQGGAGSRNEVHGDVHDSQGFPAGYIRHLVFRQELQLLGKALGRGGFDLLLALAHCF